jgi:hypothetical protein
MADSSEIKEIMENLGEALEDIGFPGPAEEMQQGNLARAIAHANGPDQWMRIDAYLKALFETCKEHQPQTPAVQQAKRLIHSAFQAVKDAVNE